VLDRLYSCAIPAACTTLGEGRCASAKWTARAGKGVAGVAALVLCNTAAYQEGIYCGGTEPAICADGYRNNIALDACEACPSRAQVAGRLVSVITAVVVLIMLLIAFLALWQNSAMRSAKSAAAMVRDLMAEFLEQSQHKKIHVAKAACNILVGYFQVMGSLPSIYSPELIPDGIRRFLRYSGSVNVNVDSMLDMRCLAYHFLTSDSAKVSSYWYAFWQSVCLPWACAVFFVLLYFYLLWRRGDSVDISKPEERRRWRSDTRVACFGYALFVMMFMHPGISTVIFQVFQCESVYFDDPDLQMQHWLQHDSSQECHTSEYALKVGLACVTIIGYLFGFPVLLLLGMRCLRQYQLVRMPREEVERHADLMTRRVWLFATDDAPVLRRFAADSQGVVEASAASVEGNGGLDAKRQPVALDARWQSVTLDAERQSIALDAERQSIALDAERQSIALDAERQSIALPVYRWALQWRREVARRATEMDMYVLKSTFAQCCGSDPASLIAARRDLDAKQNFRTRRILGRGLSERERARKSKWLRQASKKALGEAAGSEHDFEGTILTYDGRLIHGVVCPMRPDVGAHGDITYVPITWLDSTRLIQALEQFRECYKDEYYYWQSVEIMRRMLQTGIVVLMGMCFGEDMALVYAACVAGLFIVMHQRYAPFKSNAVDNLQLAVLVNQFMVQMMLVTMRLKDGSDSDALGVTMLVAQFILICAIFRHIIPACTPVINKIYGKSRKALSQSQFGHYFHPGAGSAYSLQATQGSAHGSPAENLTSASRNLASAEIWLGGSNSLSEISPENNSSPHADAPVRSPDDLVIRSTDDTMLWISNAAAKSPMQRMSLSSEEDLDKFALPGPPPTPQHEDAHIDKEINVIKNRMTVVKDVAQHSPKEAIG
ncbi:hypothetical protein CYMTET_54137, partial [Cymbomonas tetramitiformis]